MNAALEVMGLGFTFPGRTSQALDQINFTLPTASITVVAGRTGSGKSTLLRALAAWIPRHSAGRMTGSVTVGGLDTRTATTAELARTVGLMQQSIDDQLCATTVAGEVAFGLENLALPVDEIHGRVGAALARFGLAGFESHQTRQLSSGQRQRLLLASLWAMRPRVLVLDEPLSQLDEQGTAALLAELRRLRDEGITIVVAEHRVDQLLPIVDRVLVLEGGRLVGAKPQAMVEAVTVGSPIAGGPTIVAAERIAARYGASSPPVFSDVTLSVAHGERIAIVGPNGAGKSTLLKVLAGIMPPAMGEVRWCDDEAGRPPVGLVPQNPDLTLFSNSVRDELAFGPRQLGLDEAEIARRVATAADEFSLDDLLDEPPQGLSQGQRLRVALTAAATLEPQVLLLDEPTIGQDPEQMHRLFSALVAAVEAGRIGAIVFSTHDAEVARRYATRILPLPAAGEGRGEGGMKRVPTSPPHPNPLPQGERGTGGALERLDARVKIVYLLALSLVSVTVDSARALLIVGAIGMAPVFALRCGWRARALVVGAIAATIWGAVLSQAMFYSFEPRTPWMTIAGVTLWREGARYGLLQSMRLVATTASGIAVCLSTSPERLLAAMTRLGSPATLAFLVTTAMRFLPTMADEWLAIRLAHRLRGYRFRPWKLAAWCIEAGMFAPLVAAALRRATTLAVSVTTRGLDPRAPRTYYDPPSRG
ncbi:MAG TPA: ATP-binding cassette domain-containing protein [Pirellulales bacterium]|jgi:energy-coupling factor transporter ATP-binding protein EcfA2/energy-coupling factor transporter transmembrane protein EcfT|nr:ATP-binding cassette domain-containing protein [Pirellulales bacterium]